MFERIRRVLLISLVITEHLVPCDVDSCDSERGVRVGGVGVDRELPVVDAAREPNRSEDDALLPSVHRHRQVVVGEHQAAVGTVAERRVEREPRNCTFEPENMSTRDACAEDEAEITLSGVQTNRFRVVALAEAVERLHSSVVHRIEVQSINRANSLLPAVDLLCVVPRESSTH